jgi:general secretion pathway protein D
LPGLSRLPILGHLFGTKEKTDTRRELVVLLTPHIWSSGQRIDSPDELAMRGRPRGREGNQQISGIESTSRRLPVPARPASSGIGPTRAGTPMPIPPSGPMLTPSFPLQDLVPAPPSPVSPPPSVAVAPRTEVIETSDRIQLVDTLESGSRTTFEDIRSSSSTPAEFHSLPIPGPIPKVDPMLTQAAVETHRVMQPAPAAFPIETHDLRWHVVRKGEDFPSIAQDYYGSPRLARALWWVNRSTVAWPQALVPGTRIIIPPLNQLEQSPVEPQASRQKVSDPRVQPVRRNPDTSRTPGNQPGDSKRHDTDLLTASSDAPQAVSGYSIHVVQRYETLTSIARDRLGDPRRSREIATLNSDLLTNEGRLARGMRLLLPADARPTRSR